jgi:hypothetical protein
LQVLFLEKRCGIWIAKSTGIGFAIIGIMAMLGLVTITTEKMSNMKGM